MTKEAHECTWCGEKIQPDEPHWHLISRSGTCEYIYCARYAGCRVERAERVRRGARSLRRVRARQD